MLISNTQETTPLLLSIQYTYTKNVRHDFTNQPRPCHNFVFMLEGEGVVLSNNKTFRLRSGDILFIPKNTTYQYNWIPNPKAVFHSLHFSFHAKNDPLLNKNIPVQTLDNTQFPELYRLLKEIEAYQFNKDLRFFFALSAFYKICGTLLNGIKINDCEPINKTISPAIAYIEQNYNAKISVNVLADLCFLSPSRFFYLFKQQTGNSPIAYKNKIAVQYAAQELLFNKDVSIKEIAERHGFSNFIYFERAFKKIIGKTPSQYRKEERPL